MEVVLEKTMDLILFSPFNMTKIDLPSDSPVGKYQGTNLMKESQ